MVCAPISPRADGELVGGFALEGRFVSPCVGWDGAAVLAGWLGARCDVSVRLLRVCVRGGCCAEAVERCELPRGVRGSPGAAGCPCPGQQYTAISLRREIKPN